MRDVDDPSTAELLFQIGAGLIEDSEPTKCLMEALEDINLTEPLKRILFIINTSKEGEVKWFYKKLFEPQTPSADMNSSYAKSVTEKKPSPHLGNSASSKR